MTGRRIVLTTLGSYGDVNPYLELARELAVRGHDPVVATSPYYRAYVEGEGVGFRPVRPDVDPHDEEVVPRILDRWRGTEYLVRDFLVPPLRDSYEDLRDAALGADLLVTHPITLAGPIVAEKEGLPWVSTVLAPVSFLSVHDVPVFPPAPWVKRLEGVPGLARLFVAAAHRAAAAWTGPVRRLRSDLGLPAGGNPLFEGQHSPYRVLALFSRLLAAPQPDWPDGTRVTGHVFHDRPPPTGAAGRMDGTEVAGVAELEAFLEAGEAPVVFTLGSSAVTAAGDFYAESAEAARRLGIRAVLLTGPHPRNLPVGRLPDDVLAVEAAPYADLFPRAAAIVHQGGIGTLAQALRAGRPMLIVPFAHDQPDNAWRARRLAVARTVPRRKYRARAVTRELGALLRDSRYRERAERVGRVVRGEGGAAGACDAIEEVLAGH